MHLTPGLNIWLARASFWVFELHVDVWILWYDIRMHLVYSLTFLYQLYDWISSNLQYISVCIGFLPGILNLGFIRSMDIHVQCLWLFLQPLICCWLSYEYQWLHWHFNSIIGLSLDCKGFFKLMSFKLILTFIAHIESFDY